MKKILILPLILASIIFMNMNMVFAYQEGSNVLTNNSYTITYESKYLASSTQPMLEISIAFNGDAIGYDAIVINGIYGAPYIYDTSTKFSGIGQGYSPQTQIDDYSLYYLDATNPILRPTSVVKTLNEPIKSNTVLKLYYYYQIGTAPDPLSQIVSYIKTNVSIILIQGGGGFAEGYEKGIRDSEQYYKDLIEQLREQITHESELGYETARNQYGIYYNGQWLTAEEYGLIQYNLGKDENVSNENTLSVVFGGIAALLGTALAFILQLGSIEIMGVSLNMIIGIGLLIVGLFAILGLIYGGK